jgi:hypothetical protein
VGPDVPLLFLQCPSLELPGKHSDAAVFFAVGILLSVGYVGRFGNCHGTGDVALTPLPSIDLDLERLDDRRLLQRTNTADTSAVGCAICTAV